MNNRVHILPQRQSQSTLGSHRSPRRTHRRRRFSTPDQKRHLDALIDEENPENISEILQGLHHLVNKDSNSVWAAMKLSTIYKTGFGVEINLEWAIDYMDQAAEKGDSLAKANMAYCYYTGEGRSKDLHKALTLLVEANQHPLLKGKYTPFIEKIQQELLQEGEGTKL